MRTHEVTRATRDRDQDRNRIHIAADPRAKGRRGAFVIACEAATARRSRVVPDRKKQSARRACRGRFNG